MIFSSSCGRIRPLVYSNLENCHQSKENQKKFVVFTCLLDFSIFVYAFFYRFLLRNWFLRKKFILCVTVTVNEFKMLQVATTSLFKSLIIASDLFHDSPKISVSELKLLK